MPRQRGVLEPLEARVATEQEAQGLLKAAEVNEQRGLAKNEAKQVTIALLGRQSFDVRESRVVVRQPIIGLLQAIGIDGLQGLSGRCMKGSATGDPGESHHRVVTHAHDGLGLHSHS